MAVNDTRVYEMSPADNVLYFPNNIDVRLCPKNGMSTLKELQRHHTGHKEYIGRVERLTEVRKKGDQFDIPFRKGSYRIAVSRDPVSRFRSACEYIVTNQAKHISAGRIHELPTLDSELDKVITKIEEGVIKNNHFYTQSWYMGYPSEYHMVVDIAQLSPLLLFINDAAGLKLPEEKLHIHDNKSGMRIYNTMMTPEQITRIKSLYHDDYENGWCKPDDKR
jgi:hypothetical protein